MIHKKVNNSESYKSSCYPSSCWNLICHLIILVQAVLSTINPISILIRKVITCCIYWALTISAPLTNIIICNKFSISKNRAHSPWIQNYGSLNTSNFHPCTCLAGATHNFQIVGRASETQLDNLKLDNLVIKELKKARTSQMSDNYNAVGL